MMGAKGCSQEKRPHVRAFGKGVGPEFEGSTRSGCCHCWQPLQVSRLPTGANFSSTSCLRPVVKKPRGPTVDHDHLQSTVKYPADLFQFPNRLGCDGLESPELVGLTPELVALTPELAGLTLELSDLTCENGF